MRLKGQVEDLEKHPIVVCIVSVQGRTQFGVMSSKSIPGH